MKKKNTKKIYPVVIVVLFTLLISFIFINGYYQSKVRELSQEIFESTGKGFTLFPAIRNIRPDEKVLYSGLVVSLRPGETFHGFMGLKNHDKEKFHTYKVTYDKFFKFEGEDPDNKVEDVKILPIFDKEYMELKVDSEGVEFVELNIKVPDDAEYGDYRATVKAVVIDSSAEKLRQGNIILDLAVGSIVTVLVREEPIEFEYTNLKDLSGKIAMTYVITRIEYVLSGVFVLITFFLLYLAFRSKK